MALARVADLPKVESPLGLGGLPVYTGFLPYHLYMAKRSMHEDFRNAISSSASLTRRMQEALKYYPAIMALEQAAQAADELDRGEELHRPRLDVLQHWMSQLDLVDARIGEERRRHPKRVMAESERAIAHRSKRRVKTEQLVAAVEAEIAEKGCGVSDACRNVARRMIKRGGLLEGKALDKATEGLRKAYYRRLGKKPVTPL